MLLFTGGTGLSAEFLEEQSSERTISFAKEVLPVLSNKCFACHGPDAEASDNVRLDSFESATEERFDRRAIDPERPEESLILERILSSDDPMPPIDAEKQLTESERQLLKDWIQQGGNYETHWAYVPPKRSPRKREKDRTDHGRSNMIDTLIASKLQDRGVDFAEPADRATLARRTALVLIGLPPTLEMLEQFLADESEDAFSQYVDTLLQDPRYGEHQARYWLDAVRYGDTHGLHLDNRRGIYPYRDWVVRAVNQNLPLDDFITWQLAGDLLPKPTLEQLTATGFVRMNPSTGEGGAIPEEFQAKNTFDRVETFGTVLLGTSLTCARCHTHKYDPILQEEYYSLFAFFNNTAESPLDGNSYTYGDTAAVPKDQEGWKRWAETESLRSKLIAQADKVFADTKAHAQLLAFARDLAIADKPLPEDGLADETLADETLADETLADETLADETLADEVATDKNADTSGDVTDETLAESPESANDAKRIRLWRRLVETESWSSLSLSDKTGILAHAPEPLIDLTMQQMAVQCWEADQERQTSFTTTLVARELERPRETFVLKRGEYDQPIGKPIQPGVPRVLGTPGDRPANRLGLATWLTDRNHPLVSRVLVNRIWQRVFGHGLVRTPEDFGLQGEQPTHPELLDWLAIELQESGWDLKRMLRMMVESRTFQQHSRMRSGIDDPENRLWARGPSFRMDAEVLRDIGLWASNLLDAHLGGEGVKPYQPAGMWQALAHPASNTKSTPKIPAVDCIDVVSMSIGKGRVLIQ